ncbi:uncharacterized protein UV8b_06693 [Ustilaginoidea virens]|uniref:Uncharacterized protein n=1 Tax=Ustilaginoidea virens TaxID=1159556 RepID=A0A8E5HVX6_USTVR|nr:uncharacterized protein UV8b_06693 [Ustilaginoidea virens]QUC22452.1 hypothetical protein UV8b_06693 [Ustilaginoidea virens]
MRRAQQNIPETRESLARLALFLWAASDPPPVAVLGRAPENRGIWDSCFCSASFQLARRLEGFARASSWDRMAYATLLACGNSEREKGFVKIWDAFGDGGWFRQVDGPEHTHPPGGFYTERGSIIPR